jgi:hypothetical protein
MIIIKSSNPANALDRYKPGMWRNVVAELGVPPRVAETMTWRMGEADIARRAGVTTLSHESHRSIPSEMMQPQLPHSTYARTQPVPALPTDWTTQAYREPPKPNDDAHYSQGPGLPTIQNQSQPRDVGLLPGVAEMAMGVSLYSAPAGWPSRVSMTASGQRGPLLPWIGIPRRLPALGHHQSALPLV